MRHATLTPLSTNEYGLAAGSREILDWENRAIIQHLYRPNHDC